jgi:hypothetical protein
MNNTLNHRSCTYWKYITLFVTEKTILFWDLFDWTDGVSRSILCSLMCWRTDFPLDRMYVIFLPLYPPVLRSLLLSTLSFQLSILMSARSIWPSVITSLRPVIALQAEAPAHNHRRFLIQQRLFHFRHPLSPRLAFLTASLSSWSSVTEDSFSNHHWSPTTCFVWSHHQTQNDLGYTNHTYYSTKIFHLQVYSAVTQTYIDISLLVGVYFETSKRVALQFLPRSAGAFDERDIKSCSTPASLRTAEFRRQGGPLVCPSYSKITYAVLAVHSNNSSSGQAVKIRRATDPLLSR